MLTSIVWRVLACAAMATLSNMNCFGQGGLGGAGGPIAATDGERAPSGGLALESNNPWDDPIAKPDQWRGSEFGWLMPIGADHWSRIQREDASNDATSGNPYRVGISRALDGGPAIPGRNGLLFQTPEGRWCWRLTLRSQGALQTGVIISKLDLVPGGRVVIGSSDPQVPWTGCELRGPMGQGFIYVPPVPGEFAYIEYQGPIGGPAQPAIQIDELAHLYRGTPDQSDPAGPNCFVDVTCQAIDGNARDSVGKMLFTSGGSQFVCSGALLSDVDPNTFVAWFLTANHCMSTQAEASTLTVYWRYQTSVCNGAAAFQGTTTGATLVSHGAATDFCFLRLANDVNLGQGIAGFSAGTITVPTAYVGIHHPGGSFKRFSVGQATAQEPICEADLPTGSFAYLHWSNGATAGGSSGSPLFDPGNEWRVIGQLYGLCYFNGCAGDCTNFSCWNAVYGRFSGTYSVVTPWLNTIQTEDGYEPNDTLQSAQPLGLGTYDLRLADYDDYFAITLPSPISLQISVNYSESEMNLGLKLYSQAGTLLQSSNQTNGIESISRQVSAGTYIIGVSRTTGWGGAYSLRINPPLLWTNVTAGSAPSPRYAPMMVFDTARTETVLFGGGDASGYNGETWVRSGPGSGTWSQRVVSGPSPRAYHAMAFDSVRNRAVLFGGISPGGDFGDTWEWNGAAWNQLGVSGPSPRDAAAMSFDSARNVIVLFGGTLAGAFYGDTWEWDGVSWTMRDASGPSPRAYHAMAYDSVRGETVLFGGYNGVVNGETWVWNGISWTQRPVSGPSGRSNLAMDFDAARATTVLFGGINSTGTNGETWEWDGAAWNQRAVVGPSSRAYHAMTYDSNRRVTMLFGGNIGAFNAETWELGVPCIAPSISTQPATQTRCVNSIAIFTVNAAGTNVAYQWRRNGSPVIEDQGGHAIGVNSPSLTLSGLTALDAGSYDCIVTNACGNITSNPAGLTINSAPFITSQPVSAAYCPGQPASFSVAASGTGLLYQWQWRLPNAQFINLVDGPNSDPDGGALQFTVNGARTGTVTIEDVGGSGTAQSHWEKRCIISNNCGIVTSNTATLTICPADFNCDGGIDFFDYLDFVGAFSSALPPADFNSDGNIDFFDYLDFVQAFSTGC